MQLFQFLISGNRAVFIAHLEILWLLFSKHNIASADLRVTIKQIYTDKDKQVNLPSFFFLPKFERWARS